MLTGHPPYGGDTPLAVAYQHVHHDVPAAVGGGARPALARSTSWSRGRRAATRPAGRSTPARSSPRSPTCARDLGIEPVPVPTGRSTAGPGTLRPTNRPHPAPRHPSDPMTEVLGRSDRAGRAHRACCPAWAPARRRTSTAAARRRARRAPASRRTSAAGAPASPSRSSCCWPSPSAPSAGGWAPGRWTEVPELLGKQQDTAIDLLQEAGLDADCCDAAVERGRARPARSSPTDPTAGDAIRGTDVRLVVSKGPERFRVDTGAGGPADGRDVSRGCRRACRRSSSRRPSSLRQHGRRPGAVIGFDPPAGTDAQARTRSSPSWSARATSRSPSPTSPGRAPSRRRRTCSSSASSCHAGRRRPQRRGRRRRGHGRRARRRPTAGALRQHGHHHRSRPACRR